MITPERALFDELIIYAARVEEGYDMPGDELARLLQAITAREIAEGGPYALTPGGNPEELDVGLNLAIARFLRAHEVYLPNVDASIKAYLLSNNPYSSQICSKEELEELVVRYETVRSAAFETANVSFENLNSAENRVFSCIQDAARKRFEHLSDELTKQAERVIKRTMAKNPDKQMALMPHYMREALGAKGAQFTDIKVAELGLANIFFWSAFIVYDDFWDEDEDAEPRLLPTANLFARHYTDFFTSLMPKNPEFRIFFHNTMDKLDAANTWETVHCRMQKNGATLLIPPQLPAYGDYDIKYFPAAGHAFGPVAMLIELGYSLESAEVENLIEYFRHYLIAMQLNDDAHDWKEDLERGHISTAVAVLLEKWQAAHPERTDIHLENDMPELERLFWFEVLTPLCESVLSHIDCSYIALTSLSFIENPLPLEQFIAKNERIATQALAEQKKSLDFLNAFPRTI